MSKMGRNKTEEMLMGGLFLILLCWGFLIIGPALGIDLLSNFWFELAGWVIGGIGMILGGLALWRMGRLKWVLARIGLILLVIIASQIASWWTGNSLWGWLGTGVLGIYALYLANSVLGAGIKNPILRALYILFCFGGVLGTAFAIWRADKLLGVWAEKVLGIVALIALIGLAAMVVFAWKKEGEITRENLEN